MMNWRVNITKWMGLSLAEVTRATEKYDHWLRLVRNAALSIGAPIA